MNVWSFVAPPATRHYTEGNDYGRIGYEMDGDRLYSPDRGMRELPDPGESIGPRNGPAQGG